MFIAHVSTGLSQLCYLSHLIFIKPWGVGGAVLSPTCQHRYTSLEVKKLGLSTQTAQGLGLQSLSSWTKILCSSEDTVPSWCQPHLLLCHQTLEELLKDADTQSSARTRTLVGPKWRLGPDLLCNQVDLTETRWWQRTTGPRVQRDPRNPEPSLLLPKMTGARPGPTGREKAK